MSEATLRTEHVSSVARIWYGIGGAIFIAMAVLAFAVPVPATFVANIWFGALVFAGGIAEVLGAFRRHDGWGVWGEALFGIIAMIGGAVAVLFPLLGILAFTFVIIGYFLISGAVRVVQAIRQRPVRLWFLRLLSGILSLALGVYLLVMMPDIALITLGILLAVDFAFFGLALLLTAVYGERQVVARVDG